MGLPRIQVLPRDIQQYYSQPVTSPVTFFSTFETIVNAETDHDSYDIIPLEELELGMITEVTTTTTDDPDATTEAENGCNPAVLPIAIEYELTGSENETETCDLENQTYSEDNGSYTAEILSEVVSSSIHADVEKNLGHHSSTGESCYESLDIVSGNLNELAAELCNDDLVFAWLSSLDENSTISTADFESLVLPPVDKNANEVGLAKDELRSFLLSRKTKTNVVRDPEDSATSRGGRSRRDDITGTWKRVKFTDSDSEESSRHRRRQERNRIAARKCRQKRTKLAEELTSESEQLKKHNEELTSEVRDLTRELRKLENFVLDHDLQMGSYQCQEHMSTLLLSQHLPDIL